MQLLPVATGFSFIALIVYVPIWFIAIQGRDAFTAGLAILPLTAPMLVVPLLAGRMAQRVSPGLLSGIGFLLSALGAWLLMRLSPDGSLWSMAIPMLLVGIGNGLPWGLMDALSVSVVPKARAGMAAGIFTTMRVAGEAIAIAAIGAVLVGLTAENLRTAAEVGAMSLPEGATAIASQIGASGGHGTSIGSGGAMDGAVIELAHRAYTSAFHSIFGVLAVLDPDCFSLHCDTTTVSRSARYRLGVLSCSVQEPLSHHRKPFHIDFRPSGCSRLSPDAGPSLPARCFYT
nr:MFS transporter [Pectobacterium sp. PL152]